MKLDLANKEWQEFTFEDFFVIESTSSGIDRNKLINKEGNIPYLTRSKKITLTIHLFVSNLINIKQIIQML